ncbi:MAG: ATP-binding protein [Candidatus Dormiibacterota bacterium]
MPWHGDWLAAGVAALLVAGMAAYAVPLFGSVPGRWSASGFFHLAFSFAIGPPAILTMAFGQAAGSAVRRRPGVFRTLFNIGNHFLADTAAWFVFHQVAGGGSDVITLALRGAAGAAGESVVNVALLAVAVSLAGEQATVRGWLHTLVQQASVAMLFGVTAAGAVLLYGKEGTFGIVTLLLPLAMVQASMVTLARRAHEQARIQEAQAREREALLRKTADASQRAADASERERRHIASDLHDGVIQDIAGVMMSLAAARSRIGEADPPLDEFLQRADEIGHRVTRDLRSMMIELAPPELELHGLRGALQQLLGRLQREDIKSHLDCEDLDVDPPRLRLVHRVVQEAMRNAIKHAGCRNLWVTVAYQGENLVASVRDDGRGFSPEDRARRLQEDHNGLGLLEQTVRDGGGLLRVASRVGAGTVVELHAPAPAQPPTALEVPSPSIVRSRPEGASVPSRRARRPKGGARDADRGAAEPQHV